MKRIKTKLFIVILIIIAGFVYQYVTAIHDSDIQKMAQQLVENKLASQQPVNFNDVKVVKRNQYKEGESVGVCGTYQVGNDGRALLFVANIDIRDGQFSGKNQLLLSDNEDIQASIKMICQKEQP
ncbi:hypothetical protein RGN32_001015 [Providencia stuartii]|uniref:hypothetical protein n=1 Tax=Providencia stuartii TaxID=588 RepID=UPI0025AA5D97|nr:hypothetical protein [Providencia stuartii]MDN0004992.1 hypothetical protein [Providencia stuartii]